ncbi:Hypothetical_protein [Hexamita inflata]|uniref:Hypothetical_protein n=1 Tax=Hexamita inflata TaxID=28002 RepID=A0AA86NZU2_9EUKA|nr:Hypothetical protein HINF_LOCUS15536 [Hexamita inflata]
MHGGTFINHEQMNRTTQVINMIHRKHRMIQNDKSLHKDNIFSILEVGKSGLKLKDSKLIETYYNFINNQQQRYPTYNKQVEALLTFVVLFQYFQKRVQQKMLNINQNMNQICNSQASIETKLTQSIVNEGHNRLNSSKVLIIQQVKFQLVNVKLYFQQCGSNQLCINVFSPLTHFLATTSIYAYFIGRTVHIYI